MKINEKLAMKSIQEKLDCILENQGVEAKLRLANHFIEANIQDLKTGTVYICVEFNVLGHISSISWGRETLVLWHDPVKMMWDCRNFVSILEGLQIFPYVTPAMKGF